MTDFATRPLPPYLRWIYFAIGWFFVGLGVLGAFLPVLPTTPFLIISLWAFSKSSQRFESWLYNHRLFGPPLQRWRQHRVIPIQAKVMAVGAMVTSWLYLWLGVGAEWWVLVLVGGIMLIGIFYILPKPSKAPSRMTDAE